MYYQTMELYQLLFFEHARKTAQDNYAANPQDADNLTRWGGSLLEMSQFQSSNSDAKKMVQYAISKLEEALTVNPKKHEALWCLGNALASRALLTPEQEIARVDFDRASECFQQAVEEAPELHKGIHEQVFAQQAEGTAGPSISSGTKTQKKRQSSNLKYDIFGWTILAVGIVAWVGFGKPRPPPPSHSPLQ